MRCTRQKSCDDHNVDQTEENLQYHRAGALYIRACLHLEMESAAGAQPEGLARIVAASRTVLEQ